MQIIFLTALIVLTQRVLAVWPVAQPVVGEMEMHSVANLATLQTPFANFFPLKKKRPNLISFLRPTGTGSLPTELGILHVSIQVFI